MYLYMYLINYGNRWMRGVLRNTRWEGILFLVTFKRLNWKFPCWREITLFNINGFLVTFKKTINWKFPDRLFNIKCFLVTFKKTIGAKNIFLQLARFFLHLAFRVHNYKIRLFTVCSHQRTRFSHHKNTF